MKKQLLFLTFNCLVACVFAQQDAQFSQNMFNKLAINPAYAGSNKAICGTALYRNQWLGFTSNNETPTTFVLSLDAPVHVLYGGLGLNIMQDNIGREKTLGLNLAYSYKKVLGAGELSIGLNGGVLNKQLNASNWKTPDTNYDLDPAIPNSAVNEWALDMGFGVYYNISNQLYFGISSTHIPASTISSTGGVFPNAYSLDLDLKRHYYILAGYSYRLDESWELKPSVFVKTDATSAQVDLNCNIMFNQALWGGVTYRHKDAIVPMFGFQQGAFKLGLAYDVTTSALKNAEKTGQRTNTFEIVAGYCYRIPEKNEIQKKKNVRFL